MPKINPAFQLLSTTEQILYMKTLVATPATKHHVTLSLSTDSVDFCPS